MVKFSKWTHPATGEIRVYVNGLAFASRFDKVYIERQVADCFGNELNVCVRSDYKNRSEKASMENEVERLLTEKAGRRIDKWADLLAVVA